MHRGIRFSVIRQTIFAFAKYAQPTSIASMNFSVCASSSHLQSSILSGLDTTTLLGPMGASVKSLEESVSHYIEARKERLYAPTCHGKKVARNWDILFELVEIVPLRIGISHRQSASNSREGRGDVKIKGSLHIGRILAGEDGASVDSLALGDCVQPMVRSTTQIKCIEIQNIHMYGCFLFDVWASVNHWSAVHFSVVLREIYNLQRLVHCLDSNESRIIFLTSTSTVLPSSTPFSSTIFRALPYGSKRGNNSHCAVWPSTLTCEISRKLVSRRISRVSACVLESNW